MNLVTRQYDLDLGDEHWLTFTEGTPDTNLPDGSKVAAVITHKKSDGRMCQGSVWLDKMTTERWKPLTCSMSFLCHCGDHGSIRGGDWLRA